MYKPSRKELLPIRSIEDPFDHNEDINHCTITFTNFVDTLNENMNDMFETVQKKIYPLFETFVDDSLKKSQEYRKSRIAWKKFKISWDKLSIAISINLVDATQRLPLLSQLIHHYNYLRDEKLRLTSSPNDHPKKLEALNKQIEDVAKLYNTEAKQYNKVIRDFQNTVEYINNNKRFEKSIPPGKIVIQLQDIFVKLDDWMVTYENVPSKTLQQASNDIDNQFHYVQIALKNFTLYQLLELNDLTFKYIEY